MQCKVWSVEYDDFASFLIKKKPLVEGRARSRQVVFKLQVIYIWEISAGLSGSMLVIEVVVVVMVVVVAVVISSSSSSSSNIALSRVNALIHKFVICFYGRLPYHTITYHHHHTITPPHNHHHTITTSPSPHHHITTSPSHHLTISPSHHHHHHHQHHHPHHHHQH